MIKKIINWFFDHFFFLLGLFIVFCSGFVVVEVADLKESLVDTDDFKSYQDSCEQENISSCNILSIWSIALGTMLMLGLFMFVLGMSCIFIHSVYSRLRSLENKK